MNNDNCDQQQQLLSCISSQNIINYLNELVYNQQQLARKGKREREKTKTTFFSSINPGIN